MADADDVRRLALALPHVEEDRSATGSTSGSAARGSSGRIPNAGRAQPRVLRTDIAVLYVGDEAEKQALLLGEPAVFFTTPGYDGWPLVMLRLDEVDAGRLTEAGHRCVGECRARPSSPPILTRLPISRSQPARECPSPR